VGKCFPFFFNKREIVDCKIDKFGLSQKEEVFLCPNILTVVQEMIWVCENHSHYRAWDNHPCCLNTTIGNHLRYS
jgi:hypothetical protein